MNKKIIAFYLEVFCISLVSFSAIGQKISDWPATHWVHSSQNCHHLLSAPAQCRWNFVEIHHGLEGTVISYDRIQKNEKIQYAASVAILKTGKDTLRVLLLGNYDAIKKGERLKIEPDKEPNVDVSVPIDRDFYLNEERKGGKPVCRIDSYDNLVQKTAWGRVVASKVKNQK